MRLIRFFTFSLLLCASSLFAQNSQNNQGDYIVIDLSNTLPGNEIHDRLHYLFIASDEVELPETIINLLNSTQGEEFHEKLTYLRGAIMKIIYHPRISPEDKRFVCNFYIQNSTNVELIVPLLENYLAKNPN
ncbi:MAG: hypothetical protein RBT46_08020 [Weeksellaceae bacterium]|jgi:hypothetical protein|nr:hypothetical protein [Weeksellaceae bacterium]